MAENTNTGTIGLVPRSQSGGVNLSTVAGPQTPERYARHLINPALSAGGPQRILPPFVLVGTKQRRLKFIFKHDAGHFCRKQSVMPGLGKSGSPRRCLPSVPRGMAKGLVWCSAGAFARG